MALNPQAPEFQSSFSEARAPPSGSDGLASYSNSPPASLSRRNTLFLHGAEDFNFARHCIAEQDHPQIHKIERLNPSHNNWRIEFRTHEAADAALDRAMGQVSRLSTMLRKTLWIKWDDPESNHPYTRYAHPTQQAICYDDNSLYGHSLPTNPWGETYLDATPASIDTKWPPDAQWNASHQVNNAGLEDEYERHLNGHQTQRRELVQFHDFNHLLRHYYLLATSLTMWLREFGETRHQNVENQVVDVGIANDFAHSKIPALTISDGGFGHDRPESALMEMQPPPHTEQIEVPRTHFEERMTQSDTLHMQNSNENQQEDRWVDCWFQGAPDSQSETLITTSKPIFNVV